MKERSSTCWSHNIKSSICFPLTHFLSKECMHAGMKYTKPIAFYIKTVIKMVNSYLDIKIHSRAPLIYTDVRGGNAYSI